MKTLAPKHIREIILSALRSGPLRTSEIIKKVDRSRPGFTEQGIYKALRIMKAEEVIVVHKKFVSLNAPWVLKMSDYFSTARRAYLKDRSSTGHFMDLREGESIRYQFRDAVSTDAFWIHTLHILVEAHPGARWFGYNPHCWFFLVRPQSERAFKSFVEKKGGVYVMTVNGKTPLDRHIRAEFDGKHAKYHMGDKPLFPKNNYYLNVIGDFIVEAWIDKKVAAKIGKLYQSTIKYSEEAVKELADIVNSRGRSRLVISRETGKAGKLAKQLSKPFYFG